MKTWKRLLLGIGTVLVILSIFTQFLPATYHAERAIVIAARPEAIFPWINVLRKWPEWSAWSAAKDPTVIYSYEGPAEGVGAISKWTGKKFGKGRMKLTEADPVRGVKFDLDFEDEKYLSTGALLFEAAGEGTRVIWGMDGKVSRNPLERIFALFMDKMIGPDFEEGLANLKAKAEATANLAAPVVP